MLAHIRSKVRQWFTPVPDMVRCAPKALKMRYVTHSDTQRVYVCKSVIDAQVFAGRVIRTGKDVHITPLHTSSIFVYVDR